jgi:ubiquinone/menaquinone biosynthesis C-methylase UbiE
MSLDTDNDVMTTAFWRREYEKKAAHRDPVVQSGRGHRYDALELINEIRRAIVLLQIEKANSVLDVGCANGLFGLIISACCRRYIGLEPVEALASLARRNFADINNATVLTAAGGDIPLPSNSVDRVLIAEVIQLNPPQTVRRMLREVVRVLQKPGRIVILSVPNRDRQAAFESDYTEQISRADHLSNEEKASILKRQAHAHWYLGAELVDWAAELGGTARVATLPANAPNRDHRFDLVIDF